MRYIATKVSNMPNCLCGVPADGCVSDSYPLGQDDNMLKNERVKQVGQMCRETSQGEY